jgi:hypothetical protein
VSPKLSALAIDDVKEQTIEEFVPELNIIVNTRHVKNKALLSSPECCFVNTAVEVKGVFTVSF